MVKLEDLKGKKRRRLLRDFEDLKKHIEEYRDICETIEAIKHDNLPLRFNNVIYHNAYYQGVRNAFCLLDEMMQDKLETKYINATLKCGMASLENVERIMRNDPMMFIPEKDKKGKIVGYEAHFTKQIIVTDD